MGVVLERNACAEPDHAYTNLTAQSNLYVNSYIVFDSVYGLIYTACVQMTTRR